MRRLTTIGLLVFVMLALAACGGNDPGALPAGTWGESNWNQVRWGE